MGQVAVIINIKAEQAYMEERFNIQRDLFDGFEFPFYIATDGLRFTGWLAQPDRNIESITFPDFVRNV